MADKAKTVIVTGGSQGIAPRLKMFLDRWATCRGDFAQCHQVEGAAFVAEAGVGGWRYRRRRYGRESGGGNGDIDRFGPIDALLNNAGIFFTKPFVDYTADDFKRLFATNLEGFIYMTQLAIKQMLAQKSGGSIVSITAALADNPILGVNASVPMITKGGLHAITRSLAIEYAKDGIRVNAVAPDRPIRPCTPIVRRTF